MDRKVYEKTRWQNIYRHKKNKNYIIMINKPVKTSIAKINNEKIYDKDKAIEIRDNPKYRLQKKFTLNNKDTFDNLWNRYIEYCKNIEKLADKTIEKKTKAYNSFLKNKLPRITKINKQYITNYIDKLPTTDKQKNQTLKELRAFFNWCINEEILLYSPLTGVKDYKVEKTEMKYFTPEEVLKYSESINKDLSIIENPKEKETLYRTKIMFLLCYILGDRIGETRKIRFNDFDVKTNTIRIKGTKTKSSDRIVDIPSKLIDEIQKYKWYLVNELDYDILEDEKIFCNHNTKEELSDTTLRKYWKNSCIKYKLPVIRMYDLRHTFATTMMYEEIEAYLFSSVMGHTSIQTTIDKYGHITPQKRKEVAEITTKYLDFGEKSE